MAFLMTLRISGIKLLILQNVAYVDLIMPFTILVCVFNCPIFCCGVLKNLERKSAEEHLRETIDYFKERSDEFAVVTVLATAAYLSQVWASIKTISALENGISLNVAVKKLTSSLIATCFAMVVWSAIFVYFKYFDGKVIGDIAQVNLYYRVIALFYIMVLRLYFKRKLIRDRRALQRIKNELAMMREIIVEKYQEVLQREIENYNNNFEY